MKYPLTFASKKYPKFIRKSIFLRAHPKPVKLFPRIGLPNCSMSVSSLFKKASEKAAYLDYLSSLRQILAQNRQKFSEWNYFTEGYINEKSFRNDLTRLLVALGELEDRYGSYRDENKWLTKIGNKYRLEVPVHLTYLTKDKDTQMSDVVKEIVTKLKNKGKSFTGLAALSVKNATSKKSKYSKNAQIFFSSDGEKGYWDIATMSMRGISSCMRWGSGHAKSLIGSIIDPYVGVIYITDGKTTSYGSKMLARAVVRFVVDNKDKPHLFIEKAYPDAANTPLTRSLFRNFLEKKLTVQFPVVDSSDDDYDIFRIPRSEAVDDILDNRDDNFYDDSDSDLLSYRDSGITYDNVKKFYNPLKIKAQSKKKSK